MLNRRRAASLAEASMFGKRSDRGKRLRTLATLDLKSAGCVHPLVAAKIRELGISLGANLTTERFHRRMNVRMLLEA